MRTWRRMRGFPRHHREAFGVGPLHSIIAVGAWHLPTLFTVHKIESHTDLLQLPVSRPPPSSSQCVLRGCEVKGFWRHQLLGIWLEMQPYSSSEGHGSTTDIAPLETCHSSLSPIDLQLSVKLNYGSRLESEVILINIIKK